MTIQEQVKVLVEKKSTEEEIYLELLKKGFKVSEVELALKLAKKTKLDIQSRGITLIILFGAISIGLAAISFITSNWSAFGDFGKIGVISIALLLSYTGGIYAKLNELPRVYNGLLLLAQLIFGAGVFLIGEIVSIQIAPQISILIWAIGVILAAYLLKAIVLRWLMLALGIASILGIPEFFYTYDWYRRDYGIYAILALVLALELFYYVFSKFKDIDYSKYLYD